MTHHNGSLHPRRALSMAAGLLAFVSATPFAFGQQNPTDSQNSAAALDEIVVTAQKRKQRLQDVPLSVTELSTADLARANVTTMTSLPSLISGLVWSQQGAWVEPSLRGVYTSVAAVGAPSPIAIYLDGVYQPMQAGTLMDLPDVSRIETLKGPQGTLFGRNATGGAISIYTLDPSFTPTGKFDVTAGMIGGGTSRDSGHYNASGFLSGPLIGDTLAGSLSAYYDDTDGYLTNDLSNSRAGRIDTQVVRGKLLWKPADGVNVLATAYYSHRLDGVSEAGFPYGGQTSAAAYPGSIIPTQPWHIAYDGPAPDVETDTRGASLKATFDLDAGTLTSITGYSNYGVTIYTTGHAAYSPACVAVLGCIYAYLYTPEQAWSQEFDFASHAIGRFRYVAGVFAFHDQAREHDSYNDSLITDDSRVDNTSYAVFGEGTYDFTDRLSGILGLRVTRETLTADGSYSGAALAQYADKGWTSTTPRASLTYKITPNVNTYFTYSQGFKAGIVSGQANAAPPANPEKISSYELGIKAAQARYLLDAAAFYYDYSDLQVEVIKDLQSAIVTVPQNAAQAQILGLDLDGAVKWTDEFETRLDTTYLARARYSSFPNAIAFIPPLGPYGLVTDNDYDATDTRMLVAPLWTGTLSGTYTKTLTPGVLEASASLYYSSSYRWEYTGRVQTPSYDLVNARLSFSPRNSNFRYTLYGKNLTNRVYISGVTPSAETAVAFFGQPREVGLTIDYSF